MYALAQVVIAADGAADEIDRLREAEAEKRRRHVPDPYRPYRPDREEALAEALEILRGAIGGR